MIESGYCQCGCGGRTNVSTVNDASKGWVNGVPLRYLLGHNAAVTNKPRRTLGPSDWTVEDRGHETPCWIWNGPPANTKTGHCRVGIDGHYESAHAAVYRRFVGPIPARHELHHLCEQPACVRPEHLKPLMKARHLSLHKRKLNDADVAAIRASVGVPLAALAVRYGMSKTYLCSVRTGAVR